MTDVGSAAGGILPPERWLTVAELPALVALFSAALGADVHVARLLDADFLLAHRAADLFGVLHRALADADLFLRHGLFLQPHLLLAHGNADLFARPDAAGGGGLA